MRLARKTHYGIQILTYLAVHESDWTSLRTLADELKIPLSFLKHIGLALKRSRILKSLGGVKGGYRLAKTPTEITLAMIFRSLGEIIRLEPCKAKQCNHTKCVTGRFWEGVSANIASAFEQTTLEQVIRASTLPSKN
jgi:Rrf2 family iron-sulfur cluster assembly transcriptional regulator